MIWRWTGALVGIDGIHEFGGYHRPVVGPLIVVVIVCRPFVGSREIVDVLFAENVAQYLVVRRVEFHLVVERTDDESVVGVVLVENLAHGPQALQFCIVVDHLLCRGLFMVGLESCNDGFSIVFPGLD